MRMIGPMVSMAMIFPLDQGRVRPLNATSQPRSKTRESRCSSLCQSQGEKQACPSSGEEEQTNEVHLVEEDNDPVKERCLLGDDAKLGFLPWIGSMDYTEAVCLDLRPGEDTDNGDSNGREDDAEHSETPPPVIGGVADRSGDCGTNPGTNEAIDEVLAKSRV